MLERGIVILVGEAEGRPVIRRSLEQVADVVTVATAAEALGAARDAGARVVVVDLRAQPEPGLAAMEELRRSPQALLLVAVGAKKDPDLILRTMRAGACEFVVPDGGAELASVIGELLRQHDGHQVGSILGVFPCKGGMGATSLAVNVAGVLRAGGKRVVLVDLDLQLGDVLVSLDMTSRYSMLDLLHSRDRLDEDLLVSSLARHRSGVYVLAPPEHPEDGQVLAASDASELLELLTRHFDYVVCDGLRGFDGMSTTVGDACQQLLLLVQQSLPCLKNAQRCLEVFRRLDWDASKVRLVINRYRANDSIEMASIVETLGLEATGVIANDFVTMQRAGNRGELLVDFAPKAKVTLDLLRMVKAVTGVEPRRDRRSVFQALFGKKTPHVEVAEASHDHAV